MVVNNIQKLNLDKVKLVRPKLLEQINLNFLLRLPLNIKSLLLIKYS